MNFSRSVLAGLVAAVMAVALAACGGSSSSDKPAATPASTTAASTTQAGASGTKEVELVKSVRPVIDKLTLALKGTDVAAARSAYDAYDGAWNGIEVYINVRSRDLYNALEQDLQAKIADGLQVDQPKLADLVPTSEALGKKYDEAIALVQKGPPLSPLFDDLSTLRITRSDLRLVTSSLAAGDLPKAKSSFATFKKTYAGVVSLVKARSTTVEPEISAALTQVDTAMQASGATADSLKAPVANLTARYNFAVNLWNAAARNADLTKATYTDDDLRYLSALNDAQIQLKASLTAWNAANYTASTTATTAVSADFDKVQAPLAAKSSDTALKTALDAYAKLAGAAGDATALATSNKAATEAVAIAQQVLVGQFWSDPKLQTYLAGLPKA